RRFSFEDMAGNRFKLQFKLLRNDEFLIFEASVHIEKGDLPLLVSVAKRRVDDDLAGAADDLVTVAGGRQDAAVDERVDSAWESEHDRDVGIDAGFRIEVGPADDILGLGAD